MNGKNETPSPGSPAGLPVFEGADRVYRLIGVLYLRSRFGDRPRKMSETDVRWDVPVSRDERSGRKGLPMVSLVQPAGPDNLCGAIDGLLDGAKRAGVRHAYVKRFEGRRWEGADTGTWSKADVVLIRGLLRNARNGLVDCPNARTSHLRFPLFRLVYGLMDETLNPDDPDPDATVRQLLREEGLVRRIRDAVQAVDKEIPADKIRWKLPLWLVYVSTLGVFRIALTGRIPLLSGRYRWFLLQPHLAPEMSGTFVRFAERLIGWQREAPEYVARLLVNSFLEDLRRAYLLRPWNIVRRRRMTYPVLLLDDTTMTNGGDRLLRLINAVRNQTGLFDPLLVISASGTAPPDAGRVGARLLPIRPAKDAHIAYREWQNDLLEYRRARRDITWYLPIGIQPAIAVALGRQSASLNAFNGFDPDPKAVRPPLASSRWLRLGVVAAIVAAAAAVAVMSNSNHCGTWQSSLHTSGSECIGASDGSFDLFQPSDPAIRQVETTILAQNEQAKQLHAAFPVRPYITLADFQALTSSNGTADGLTAEREALEGVAVAQQRQLSKSGNGDPIVRILIVNGGAGMRQGATVAQQLGEIAQHDPTLVGVVGLDMSSQPTLDTIAALSDAGLPMVAATLSQDSLTTGHPMYFQVAPQNSTEAAVVAAFANHQVATNPSIPRTVRIYYSDDATDTYSSDLRGSAAAAFMAKGFHVTAKAFTPSGPPISQSEHALLGDQLIGDANAGGLDTCQYSGLVFFAGRGVPDYGDFLAGAAQCLSKAVFIGDDDVSRYVADATERQANQALSFYYASFAFAPPIKELQGPELDFYHTLDTLFPFEKDPVQDRSLDGHAALSYDAADVLITAVSYLRAGNDAIPITPGAVWREITDIHGSQAQHRLIDGVSGTIDYGGDITRQVPLDKPVAILRVTGGAVDSSAVAFCGMAAGHTASLWCPANS